MGIPLVDADGMGRAFPEIQMVTPTMYGVSATPTFLVNGRLVRDNETLPAIVAEEVAAAR